MRGIYRSALLLLMERTAQREMDAWQRLALRCRILARISRAAS
jgi:hypothetical protein